MKATLTITISKVIDVDTSPMDEESDLYGQTPIDRAANPILRSFGSEGWNVGDWTYQLEEDQTIEVQES